MSPPFVQSVTRDVHVFIDNDSPTEPLPRPMTASASSRCSHPSQYGQW